MVRALLAGRARVGFSGLRPSGHHAGHDRAMGFCLFNNVALTAETAIADHGVERGLIIDWDVHHGNGTAEIFCRRDDVLFASIHQSGLYPGTGALQDSGSGAGMGYTINLPVYAGSEGELWLLLLEHIMCQVRELAVELDAPIGAILEGGYNPEALGDCVVATLAALTGAGTADEIALDPILAGRAAAQIGRYWEL